MSNRSITYALSVIACLATANQAQAQDEAHALLNRSATARQLIKSGSVHFKLSVSRMPDGEQNLEEDGLSEYAIDFGPGQLRFDRWQQIPTISAHGHELLEKVIAREGIVIQHSETFPAQDPLCVTISKQEKQESKRPRIFDPRVVGMWACAVGHLHHVDMDSALESLHARIEQASKEGLLKITDSTIDGIECRQVTIGDTEQRTISITFAPSLGGSILKMVVKTSHESAPLRDEVTCQIEKFEGDIYFPRTVRFRRSLDGTVRRDELFTVERAIFNRDVNPKRFTIEGMGVPAGVPVLEDPPNPEGTLQWDGKKLSQLPCLKSPGVRLSQAQMLPNELGMALLGIGGGLIVISAAKRRRSNMSDAA